MSLNEDLKFSVKSKFNIKELGLYDCNVSNDFDSIENRFSLICKAVSEWGLKDSLQQLSLFENSYKADPELQYSAKDAGEAAGIRRDKIVSKP